MHCSHSKTSSAAPPQLRSGITAKTPNWSVFNRSTVNQRQMLASPPPGPTPAVVPGPGLSRLWGMDAKRKLVGCVAMGIVLQTHRLNKPSAIYPKTKKLTSFLGSLKISNNSITRMWKTAQSVFRQHAHHQNVKTVSILGLPVLMSEGWLVQWNKVWSEHVKET